MSKTQERRLALLDYLHPLRSLHKRMKDGLDEIRGTNPKQMTLDQKIKSIQKALQRTSQNHPDRLLYLSGLASAFQLRFYNMHLEADLDQWIQYAQQLLDASGSATREEALGMLAHGVLNRYLRLHKLTDLEKSIHCSQQIVQESRADSHPPVHHLLILSHGLRERYLQLHQIQDLEQSILYAQRAIDTQPAGSPDERAYLQNLGASLSCKFTKSGQLSDLEASIQFAQRALYATPPEHPKLAAYLQTLGDRLGDRYEKVSSPADLEQSIQYHLQALGATSEEDRHRPSYLDSLAAGYKRRYNKFGQLDDLEQFIRYAEQAVNTARTASGPNNPVYLTTAATGHYIRYERLGQVFDLHKSIQFAQQALDLSSADHPRRGQFLVSLSTKLRTRAKRLGRPEDLAQAIRIAQDAVDLAPKDHPERASRLSKLGLAYFDAFQRFGQVANLDHSIKNIQTAISTSPYSDTASYKFYLLQLGGALSARFSTTHQLADLEQSTKCKQEAVNHFSADGPERASALSSLGGTYLQRFRVWERSVDLDQAIRTYQLSLIGVPAGHTSRPTFLMSLASAFDARFKKFGHIDDIEEAVKHCHEALLATDHSHEEQRKVCFQHLGKVYKSRFERTGQNTDLEQSIRYTQQALELATSVDDPERPNLLLHIGSSYRLLLEQSQSNEDLEKSNNALEEAFMIFKVPSLRLVSGLFIVLNCLSNESWRYAATLIDRIITVLPDVIPPSSSRDDAQIILRRLSYMLSLLPTIYLNAGRSPMAAIEALESFRGIIASLMVDAKSDVSMLKEEHPELWAQYTQCRNQIAGLSLDTTSALELDAAQSYTARSQQHQQLYNELQDLRNEIRKCPGFEKFLLPPKGEEITDLAKDGPLVCFNVNEWGNHAFLVTSTGVEAISLPNLDIAYMKETMLLFNARADLERRDAQVIDSDDEADVTAEQSEPLLHLWNNATKPVLQRLGILREASSSEQLPRIWWVGGGIMSLMPLHAAGAHTAGSTENTLSHVVSSYTPSLKILQFLRSKPPLSLNTETRKLLIVSMPTTPGGYGSLNTTDEVAAIEKHSQGLVAVKQLIQPTKRDVIEALHSCALAHFACHGGVNSVEPAKSSLILGRETEENLTVNETIDIVKCTGARIAYLSACSTAEIKAHNLINEAIHLASAFQLAGFQHVIGTLWRADDSTAVAIAGKFYEILFQEEKMTDRDVSCALHNAVLQYRGTHSNSAKVLKWASFIHLGC